MPNINQDILDTLSKAAGDYVWGVDKAFAKLCNSFSHPVVITSGDLEAPGPTILFANDAFLKLCGHERRDLIGRSPRVLQGAQTDPGKTVRFRQELETTGRASTSIVNYRPDGEAYGVDIHARRLVAGEMHSDVILAVEAEIPVNEALLPDLSDASSALSPPV